MKKFLALNLSDVVFIMLINVKMPKIVGILTFMSRINFVLSLVEHEKSFITLGPDFIGVLVCSGSGCKSRDHEFKHQLGQLFLLFLEHSGSLVECSA